MIDQMLISSLSLSLSQHEFVYPDFNLILFLPFSECHVSTTCQQSDGTLKGGQNSIDGSINHHCPSNPLSKSASTIEMESRGVERESTRSC